VCFTCASQLKIYLLDFVQIGLTYCNRKNVLTVTENVKLVTENVKLVTENVKLVTENVKLVTENVKLASDLYIFYLNPYCNFNLSMVRQD